MYVLLENSNCLIVWTSAIRFQKCNISSIKRLVLTFVFQFNEFIWPLVAVSSESMRPITTGLTLFNQEFFTQWNLTAVGGMLLFLPCFLLFVIMQRYFVQSVMLSGMK